MNNNRINFIFLRHGNACHNVVKSLVTTKRGYIDIKNDIKDAQLTHFGVDFSIWSGCIIKNILKVMGNLYEEDYDDIDDIDIIGTSPLIRSIETGYYMTKNWKKDPERIYVLPYLREIDERIFNTKGLTKYTDPAIYNVPQYAMKTIDEQKSYLSDSLKMDANNIDFSYVERFKLERESPGDINKFIRWFYENFKSKLGNKKSYNVIIITHSGVIREFFKKSVFNNFGLILPVFIKNDDELDIQKDKIVDIADLFPKDILKNIGYNAKNICGVGQSRCNVVCKEYNLNNNNKLLEKIDFEPLCYEMQKGGQEKKEDIDEFDDKENINRWMNI